MSNNIVSIDGKPLHYPYFQCKHCEFATNSYHSISQHCEYIHNLDTYEISKHWQKVYDPTLEQNKESCQK